MDDPAHVPVSCCPAEHEVKQAEQMRLDVAVGGTVWYVVPFVHVVQETHTVLEEPEQPPLAYEPDAQAEQVLQADCDTNWPLGQDDRHVPLSCKMLLPMHDVHCVAAGPVQLRQVGLHAKHEAPLL